MPPCLFSALPRLPQKHGGRSWRPESMLLSSCLPSHIQRPMETQSLQHWALHEGSARSLGHWLFSSPPELGTNCNSPQMHGTAGAGPKACILVRSG